MATMTCRPRARAKAASPTPHLLVRKYLADKAKGGGEQFVSERDIAREFSLSRSHSRKVLTALENEGVVQCVPQRGYRLLDYVNVENETLYRLRTMVEKEAARLASRNATREDILRMWLVLDEAEKAIAEKDQERFAKLDFEFHQALVDSAHNTLVTRMYGFLFFQTLRQTPWPEGGYQETHRAHWRILNALREQDADEAQRAAYDHIGHNLPAGMVLDGVSAPTVPVEA